MARPRYHSRLMSFAELEIEPICTLDEAARALGVSRERVRQLECRALNKLRRALQERGYRLDDLLDIDRRRVRS